MSDEMNNMPVELSEDELDDVNGGFGGIALGGGQNLALNAFSNFHQQSVVFNQQTFSGVGGSFTNTFFAAQETYSESSQTLTITNS
ncbi:MAG: CTB family bacteriocin [Mastigocoleus sp.]